jgi:signal transduction histidine kinase
VNFGKNSLVYKVLLIIQLFILGSPLISLSQDDLTVKLDWYESFFGRKYDQSADELLRVANHKLEEAKESNDIALQASLKKEIALIQLTRVPNYEAAMNFFIEALSTEDSLQLRQDQIITYLGLAKVFEEVGDYYKSAELLEHAMELSRTYNNVNVLVHIANRLGKINASRGELNYAFENYQLVLNNKTNLHSPKAEGDALFNIAHLFQLQKKYTDALAYHKSALAIRRQMNDKQSESQSLNDIGQLYQAMGNNDKALANHVVALEIRRKLKDEAGLAQSYNNIGVLYFNQKNYDRAVANFNLGLASANAAQSPEQRARSYEYLSYCYKAVGDYAKALEYKELFIDIMEFLRLEKLEVELLESQNRYVLGKKELEIKQLELQQRQRDHELKTQKKFQNFLFVLIGFGVIIILLVVYLYLIKRRSNRTLEAAHAKVNRQNQELQNLNATKDKFFSIISHDLKGPLNSFTAFSGMLINYTDSLSKEEIQMLAKEIDKNLKNLFTLLENLLEWSRSQTGSIEFKAEPFDLNDLLTQNRDLLTTQAQNKKITIEYIDGGSLPVSAHKHSVNTVIRNLISNAIKFTPEGGRITLSARADSASVTVSIRDTGVGMSPEVLNKLFRIDTKYSTQGTASEKGTGLGLILCKDFIEKNGGSMAVESEVGVGSVFSFTLPNKFAPKSTVPSATMIASR